MNKDLVSKDLAARVRAGRLLFGLIVGVAALLLATALTFTGAGTAHAASSKCTVTVPVDVLYVNAGQFEDGYKVEAARNDGRLEIELSCSQRGEHDRHRVSGVELKQKLSENVALDDRAKVLLRPDYQLVGWTHAADVDGSWNPASPSIISFSRSNVTMAKDHGIYLVAKKTTTLGLSFDANDAEGPSVEPGTMPQNMEAQSNGGVHVFRIDRTEPQREGYVFFGWLDAKNPANVYGPGNSVIVRESAALFRQTAKGAGSFKTLRAQWLPVHQHSLNFNPNGAGVTGMPAAQIAEGTSEDLVNGAMPIKISSERPMRAGYEFVGWSAVPNANEASYEPGDVVSVNKAMVLYAVWGPERGAIDAGVGTGSTVTTFPEESPAPGAPAPTTPTTTPTTVTGGDFTTTVAVSVADDADAAGAAGNPATPEGADADAASEETIADEANPLVADAGSERGQDAATVSIEDDETALASGLEQDPAEDNSWAAVGFGLGFVAVAAAGLWWFLIKRKSNDGASAEASSSDEM